MNSPSPKEIVANIHQIGTMPQTLAAVLKVLNNPDSGAKEIADIISTDISLASLVLKMVNTAHYGRSRKISRISEAVTLMGINSIKILALSSSVLNLVGCNDKIGKQIIRRINRHLIEVAVTARRIAEESKAADPEEAFVAGILHDVGIIVMALHFKDDYLKLIEKLPTLERPLPIAERNRFGCTHGDVGAELGETWKLPPRLVYTIQNHHESCDTGIIEEDSSLNYVIALADRTTMGPFEENHANLEDHIELVQTISEKLNLSNQSLNEIRRESIVQSIKLSHYLDLDIGDVIDIVADANNKLAELYCSMERLYSEKQDLLKRLENPVSEPIAS
jgi:putative nucleotidyltransferase with HDIG domain